MLKPILTILCLSLSVPAFAQTPLASPTPTSSVVTAADIRAAMIAAQQQREAEDRAYAARQAERDRIVQDALDRVDRYLATYAGSSSRSSSSVIYMPPPMPIYYPVRPAVAPLPWYVPEHRSHAVYCTSAVTGTLISTFCQ